MLWIGAILCFACYGLQTSYTDKTNLYLAFVVICVVLITGNLSFY